LPRPIETILERLFPKTITGIWADSFTFGLERGRLEARNEIIVELDKIRAGDYDLPIGINREATVDLIINKAIEIAMDARIITERVKN
tara:strand:+ start:316 stop:579 length:264 start_codon:yes stop_codon:yes gene_type:complete